MNNCGGKMAKNKPLSPLSKGDVTAVTERFVPRG